MLVNGVLSDTISASDRGLLYGDGVFRTMRVTNGKLCHWSLHYQKLQQDCAALLLDCPPANSLLNEIEVLLMPGSHGVVRLTLTRGEAVRGYAIPAATPVTRVITVSPLPAYPAEFLRDGVRLHQCQLRLAVQPRLAGIKHLNRLENVLAASEWNDPSIAEGLLLDQSDNVVGGTRSNLFIRSGDRLATPDLTRCGVSGVQRRRVLDWCAHEGMEVAVRDISLDELVRADEVFLCNSVFGLWSVNELCGSAKWRSFPMADRLRKGLESRE